MVLVGILTGLFVSIIDAQLESESTSSIDQDARFIMSRLTYDIQSASDVALPASLGAQGNTLQLSVNSINYTYSLDGSGNLRLINGSGTNNLNSAESSVSALLFHRVGTGSTNQTVRVSYTITSKIKRLSGTVNETRNYQTTIAVNQ